MRKGSKNWICSALRKESLGESESSCTTIYRVATKNDGDFFFSGSNLEKTWGNGHKLLLVRF